MKRQNQPALQSSIRWRRSGILLAATLGAVLVLLALFAPVEFQRLAIRILAPGNQAGFIPDRGALAMGRLALISGLVLIAILALIRLDGAHYTPAPQRVWLGRGQWLCLILTAVCSVAFALSLRPHYRLANDSLWVFTTFDRSEIRLRDLTAARITLSPPGGSGYRRLRSGDIRRTLILRSGSSEQVIRAMTPADIAAIVAALPAGPPCVVHADSIGDTSRPLYLAELQRAIHQTSGTERCPVVGAPVPAQP